jgi:4-hydroxybenzoate polyprenyltransferase
VNKNIIYEGEIMGKIITTIIITAIFLVITIAYGVGILLGVSEGMPKFIALALIIVVCVFAYALIHNMIERIKEIKRGDENDISKY